MVFPKMKSEWQMIVIATLVILGAHVIMAGLSQSDVATHGESLVSQDAIAELAAPAIPAVVASNCPITLDLLEDANAMIGLTLLAPCLPASDVMIAHAGMIFSAQTMASGSLFLSLPALTRDAKVSVRFTTGETADAAIDVPDIASLRRFVVQWPESDGFALHAYEGDAGFDGAGHIWAQNLAIPFPGEIPNSGYLTLVGDKTTKMPMLAQIYTYPARQPAEVIVEAEVTPNNCGFDLMGDVISSVGGTLEKAEITVAMPECDAVGEFVQIIGLAAEIKLALSN